MRILLIVFPNTGRIYCRYSGYFQILAICDSSGMRFRMEQDKVRKLSDVGQNVRAEDGDRRKKMEQEKQVSYRQRWDKAQATKKVVFWIAVAAITLTLIVGFSWGGWVTGGTAQKMTNDAVAQRLSSICVGQFNKDPQKDQKLTELKDTSSYKRDDYVKKQGWATMPGEEKPDNKVADGCAKLLAQVNQ